MVRIVRDARLVAVPVDVDLADMRPSLEWLDRAITPRSKVLVAAHLFGARVDFDPLFRRARERGLITVEDCAQAFNGRDYPGSEAADLNLFSFGPIKTATALGGALIRVRDPELRERMRAREASYPVQPQSKQLKRVAQFIALKLLTARPALSVIYRYYRAKGQDYEDALAERARDVAPLKTARNLRWRPSAGMLALLNRRLATFDGASIRARTRSGERLRDLLNGSVELPAQASRHHDYWVFPLLVGEPKRFISGLRAEGFDAADLPRSQHIAAPTDRPELEPVNAARVIRDIVVVPCYQAMPEREIERQAGIIRRLAAEAKGQTSMTDIALDAPSRLSHKAG
jgi:dTDP-4-amino-4,6-dideoxygalactose transaminase